METIVISTILVNICIGCFACVGLTTAISMIQSIINDHKREKPLSNLSTCWRWNSLPPAHFLTKGDNL